MNSKTCNRPNGACKKVFSRGTFDDLAAQSRQHGTEILRVNNSPHMVDVRKIKELMKSGEIDSWIAARHAEFGTL